MNLPFDRTVTLITRVTGDRADFRDGVPTETSSTIRAVVQPATRADNRVLEARGLSVNVQRVLFTAATIVTADELDNRLSDLVEVDGERLEVVATEPHSLGAPGGMLHTKAYLTRYYLEGEEA